MYKGPKDSIDHIQTYKTYMILQGTPDEIMLKGPARRWFGNLRPEFMGSFDDLCK
jgi:hypothetical protein